MGQCAGGHVGLLWQRATCAGRLYLERECCGALGRNGALPVGCDLLRAQIRRRSLLAFVS
jgi:hypothetical protein